MGFHFIHRNSDLNTRESLLGLNALERTSVNILVLPDSEMHPYTVTRIQEIFAKTSVHLLFVSIKSQAIIY